MSLVVHLDIPCPYRSKMAIKQSKTKHSKEDYMKHEEAPTGQRRDNLDIKNAVKGV